MAAIDILFTGLILFDPAGGVATKGRAYLIPDDVHKLHVQQVQIYENGKAVPPVPLAGATSVRLFDGEAWSDSTPLNVDKVKALLPSLQSVVTSTQTHSGAVTVDKPGVPVELGGAVLPDASLGLLQYCYFSDAASAVKYESVLAGSVVQKFEIKNADAARIEIVTGGKTSTIPLKNVTHIHFSNDARSGADGNHFGIYYGTLASTYDPKYHLYPCRDGYPPVAHDAQRPPQKAGTNKWNRLIRLDADDPFPTRSMPVYCPPVIKE